MDEEKAKEQDEWRTRAILALQYPEEITFAQQVRNCVICSIIFVVFVVVLVVIVVRTKLYGAPW